VNEPTQRRSSQTRDAILEAAAQLVHEQGASALTLDATCSRAGMSKGGLLYHFRSKEELLVALMEQRQEFVESTVRKEYDSDPEPELPGRYHRALIRAQFGILLSEESFQHTVMGGVAVQLLASGGESSRKLNENFKCHRRAWDELLDSDDLDTVQSLIVHSALDGLVTHQIMHQENPPREILVRMRDQLLEMARTPKSRSTKNPTPETA
jgi:AcrR family transcriptional regulator